MLCWSVVYLALLTGAVSARPVQFYEFARRAALDTGSCGSPEIEFANGLDGRDQPAFQPVNQNDFNHGSALNIGIIAGFICQQLQDKCKAGQDTLNICSNAQAAAANATGGAAADAFNAAFGIETDFANPANDVAVSASAAQQASSGASASSSNANNANNANGGSCPAAVGSSSAASSAASPPPATNTSAATASGSSSASSSDDESASSSNNNSVSSSASSSASSSSNSSLSCGSCNPKSGSCNPKSGSCNPKSGSCNPAIEDGSCNPKSGSCNPKSGSCNPDSCNPASGSCNPDSCNPKSGSCNPAIEDGSCNPAIEDGSCNPAIEDGSCNPKSGSCNPNSCNPASGSCNPALDFGNCTNPAIEFGAGFDGRKASELSFQPEDQTSISHGSALNINIITQATCDQLKTKCNAPASTLAACAQGQQAASSAAPGGAQADAFNAALGITTNFATTPALSNGTVPTPDEAAQAALPNIGSCTNPNITFGIFDGRTEDSFEPANLEDFNHGSALNINIITKFICDTFVNSCNANQAAIDSCAAAQNATQGLSGQAAADAFNAAVLTPVSSS